MTYLERFGAVSIVKVNNHWEALNKFGACIVLRDTQPEVIAALEELMEEERLKDIERERVHELQFSVYNEIKRGQNEQHP